MKKVLSFILIPVLIFSLCACKRTKEPEATEYVPNTQAEIAVAYIYDGKVNIATRPKADVKLKSITLACIYYDITGKQIGSMKMIDCTVTDHQNVTLWQSDCPDLAVYADCAVYSTVDTAGKETKAARIDLWEKAAVSAFQIDTYRDKLANKLGERSVQATTNPYVKLGAVSWQSLSVTAEMELLSAEVQSVYLFALWFDANGQPVDVNVCTYCANGETMVAHINSTENLNYIFKAPDSAQSAKLIVQSVDLKNGTQWVNPYFYEWVLLNRASAK